MNDSKSTKELTGRWVREQRQKLAYAGTRDGTTRLFNFQIKLLILLALNEVQSGSYSKEVRQEIDGLARQYGLGFFDD